MSEFRKLTLLTLAMLASFLVGMFGVAHADPLKVGFVYVGPIGDHGWSYEHNQGRLSVEKEFGDKVKTTSAFVYLKRSVTKSRISLFG